LSKFLEKLNKLGTARSVGKRLKRVSLKTCSYFLILYCTWHSHY